MQALSSKWNDLRLGHEYKEARDLWINIFLNERQKNRAEIEYDYAAEELNYLQENDLETVGAQKKLEIAKEHLEASTKLMLAS